MPELLSNEPQLQDESLTEDQRAEQRNALRNALVEIGDLRTENQALHARVQTLLLRIRELTARQGANAGSDDDRVAEGKKTGGP